MIRSDQLYPAVAVVRHTLPVWGRARLGDLRTAEVGTSDQRNHARGRDGRCGSPPYPLLVRARPSVHRPDDRTGLRRSKDFRLSQGQLSDRSLLRSSFLGPRNERSNRRLSPPGFRSAPQPGGYGALVAPSTEMSCITIYGADLLERDGRAFHLVPSADHLRGSADGHGARLTARRPLRAASVRSTSNSDRTGASQ
jgi:hypothetical protein